MSTPADTDKFTDSLAGLLPEGFAWPRDPGTVLMCVVQGLAAALADDKASHEAMLLSWLPNGTARLSEWEASCGLPESWMPSGATEEERLTALQVRLRGVDLPFSDSSPAAPAVLEALCASMGYGSVEVIYHTPFRVGMRCGRRLGGLNGRLHVLVTGASPGQLSALAGMLDRYVPARFHIVLASV